MRFSKTRQGPARILPFKRRRTDRSAAGPPAQHASMPARQLRLELQETLRTAILPARLRMFFSEVAMALDAAPASAAPANVLPGPMLARIPALQGTADLGPLLTPEGDVLQPSITVAEWQRLAAIFELRDANPDAVSQEDRHWAARMVGVDGVAC